MRNTKFYHKKQYDYTDYYHYYYYWAYTKNGAQCATARVHVYCNKVQYYVVQ